jgi:hypothetical protein
VTATDVENGVPGDLGEEFSLLLEGPQRSMWPTIVVLALHQALVLCATGDFVYRTHETVKVYEALALQVPISPDVQVEVPCPGDPGTVKSVLFLSSPSKPCSLSGCISLSRQNNQDKQTHKLERAN